jgi:hypothetical protein
MMICVYLISRLRSVPSSSIRIIWKGGNGEEQGITLLRLVASFRKEAMGGLTI